VDEGNTFRSTGAKMKIYPTDQKIKISWFGVSMGQRVPANKMMRGTWGWDATCSCGWDSKTGGGVRSWVKEEVELHKIYAHNYTRIRVA
jgi:hypothetical protein